MILKLLKRTINEVMFKFVGFCEFIVTLRQSLRHYDLFTMYNGNWRE